MTAPSAQTTAADRKQSLTTARPPEATGAAPLPEGWQWKLVGAMVDQMQYGTSAKTSEDATGVPVLRMGNIQNGELVLDVLKYLPADHDEFPDLLLRDGDVLFNRTNSAELVGKTAVYRGNPMPCSCASYLIRLRLLPAYVPEFLAYYINSPFGRAWVSTVVSQQVGQANVNGTKLKALSVPVPGLAEQEQIVAEIEKQFTRLDAGVAALRRVQANLKRYRAAVLKAACEGRLVPTEAELARKEGRTFETGGDLLSRILNERRENWRNRAPYKEPGVAPVENLPQLPSGWAWAGMRQVGEVQLGRQRAPQHHAGDNMRPYLRVANVFEARIDTTDVKSMNFTPEEFTKYRLRYGDILLNEGQTPELVGRPAMFRDEISDCCYQKTLLRFRAHSGVMPQFALTVFRAYMHNRRFTRAASITTNIAHLTAEKFVEIEFPLPPPAEQARIVAEVERRLSVVEELEATVAANLQRATRLRNSVLRSAFRPWQMKLYSSKASVD